jgi:hypothetical protein
MEEASIIKCCSICVDFNEEIKENDKTCKYCKIKFPESNFRYNRLKCRDCEKLDGRNYRKSNNGKKKSKEWVEENRERMSELQANWFQKNKGYIYEKVNNRKKIDAVYKFMTLQRSRIRLALKKKQKKTNEYLGCNGEEFVDWMEYLFDDSQNLENHGKVWHIDHVIPISNFNLDNEDEIMLCLNWRNTTPLSVEKNLIKNKKVIQTQIEQHYNKLVSYHKEKNIEIPQKFVNLFATQPN